MSSDPTRINLAYDPLTQRLSGVAIHGDTPFNVPYISHIDGNLYTGGCSDGLLLPDSIEHVISLYPWESYKIRHELSSLTQVMVYDEEPDIALFKGLAQWAVACVDDGATLIHCQAGLNRSAFLAALVLIKRGMKASEAVALLREKRSSAVLCNPYMAKYLLGQGEGA